MEELDPAGGERRKGGKEGEKDGGRVQRREGEGKSTPHPSALPLLSLSLFLPEPVA